MANTRRCSPRARSSAWPIQRSRPLVTALAGGFVLEQTRGGADFIAVVVLRVTNPGPVVPGTPCDIKARVLANHGSADPITPKDGRLRGRTHAGQSRLAGDDVRWGSPFILRPDCQRWTDEKLCRQSCKLRGATL